MLGLGMLDTLGLGMRGRVRPDGYHKRIVKVVGLGASREASAAQDAKRTSHGELDAIVVQRRNDRRPQSAVLLRQRDGMV